MKLEYPQFRYLDPESMAEAVALMSSHGPDAKVLAGGTALLGLMRGRQESPELVIDIGGIPELCGIRVTPEVVVIGAATTLAEIGRTHLITRDPGLSALSEAAARVGSQQIRNAGTLGGNICHASPAGDTLPALLVLNASLRAVGPQGERSISAADFFTGPGLTVLSSQELLIEIRLPREPGLLASYLRFSPRQYQDSAVASAAASFTLDGATCTGCRIALGAVAPVPMRARSAEAYLLGKRLTPEALAAAADLAAAEASPISDVRGSAAYRAALVPVLVRRAAEAARAKAPAYSDWLP